MVWKMTMRVIWQVHVSGEVSVKYCTLYLDPVRAIYMIWYDNESYMAGIRWSECTLNTVPWPCEDTGVVGGYGIDGVLVSNNFTCASQEHTHVLSFAKLTESQKLNHNFSRQLRTYPYYVPPLPTRVGDGNYNYRVLIEEAAPIVRHLITAQNMIMLFIHCIGLYVSSSQLSPTHCEEIWLQGLPHVYEQFMVPNSHFVPLQP